MLPYFEQQAMYNATNFNLTSADQANITICGVQIRSLVCPSDPQTDPYTFPATVGSPSGTTPGWSFNNIYPLPPGTWRQAFTQLCRQRRDVHLRVLQPDEPDGPEQLQRRHLQR